MYDSGAISDHAATGQVIDETEFFSRSSDMARRRRELRFASFA
jgi:hypothetical protein